MTTIAERARLPRRTRRVPAAHALVVAGLAPAVAHLLSSTRATDLLAAAPYAAAAIAYALLYPSLSRPLAAWSAMVAGALAVADGAIHAEHVLAGGAFDDGDALGFATGAGGLVLLGVALRTARRRGPRRSLARRWGARAAAALVAAVTLVLGVAPVAAAVYLVHAQTVPIAGSALAPPHEDVTLHAWDGVELDARWIPSRNGRAVILVHGAGGDRGGGVASRAELLARHGYGVLLYDSRRGDDLGWTWYRDIYGALAFLEARGFERIGALGLSTGGGVVLDAAGRDRRIDAVASEGARPTTMADALALPWDGEKAALLPPAAVALGTYRVLTRSTPPQPVREVVPRIAPRPILLMSAGTGVEAEINRVYGAAARGPVDLWEMPGAAHAGGLDAHPREYERRLVAFFDAHL